MVGLTQAWPSPPHAAVHSTTHSPAARRHLALWLLGAALTASACVAVTPYALSQRAVLAATLTVINALAPARVYVESLSAGWGRPVEIRGLR